MVLELEVLRSCDTWTILLVIKVLVSRYHRCQELSLMLDTEEFIDRIDKERDEAANSIRGRGVHLLCRLDVRILVEMELN
jgi:hypothetical protein